jgi:hypothetical protein
MFAKLHNEPEGRDFAMLTLVEQGCPGDSLRIFSCFIIHDAGYKLMGTISYPDPLQSQLSMRKLILQKPLNIILLVQVFANHAKTFLCRPFCNYVTEIKIRTNSKLIPVSSVLPDLKRRSHCG